MVVPLHLARWWAHITPAGRGSGVAAADPRTLAERHRAMRWAQRLKRLFKLDLESCEACGDQVRV
ncbi:MAG: IS91 family transposase, partial [Gammaproteobacteria bacterium]|nr:IS91 family transposase [Gammaproteobacteria bacterium]